MMTEMSERLYKELNEGLAAIAGQDILPHLRLRDQLALIRGVLAELGRYVDAHPFENVTEEIRYHKVIYPKFKAQLILQVELFQVQSDMSLDGSVDRVGVVAHYREYFRVCLAFIEQFRFQYLYRKFGGEELDGLYFTDLGDQRSALVPVLAEMDERSTAVGYLYAKFMAYELLYEFISVELAKLVPAVGGSPGGNGGGGVGSRAFKWTGKTIDLIEIAHALHLSDEVENGNAGVVDFFKSFGDFFGVDLGVPKKGMDNLMDRKTIGRTRFLDKIRGAMHDRMEELNAYDPGRRLRKMRL